MKSKLLLFLSLFVYVSVYSQIGFQDHIILDKTDGVSNPNAVHANDLDGDGDIDLLFASRGDDKIGWYENVDGLGTFGTQKLITTNVDDPASTFSIDLDGDGDIDVLSASSEDDKIAWYENTDGLGNFGGQQIISSTVDGAFFVSAADIDGDGDMDVLSAANLINTIYWHENVDGQGNFADPQVITTIVEGIVSIYANDIDGDGDLDVLSASWYDDKLAWYENTDGQGTFGSQQLISSDVEGPYSVFSVDQDGDGDQDVLSAYWTDDKVSWYENLDGQGSFGPEQVITTEIDQGSSVFATDIDGDGDMDVLSASRTDNKIAWYENSDGQGNFNAQQIISTLAEGAIAVYAADLDADGDQDVCSVSGGANQITWYENADGQGTFSSYQTVTESAREAKSVYSTDLDGDGDMDVLSASFRDDKIAWYENTDGQGNFAKQQNITITANGATSVHTADLDGDGDQDVLSASGFGDKIAWYKNTDGQGSFGAELIISTDIEYGTSVYAADLDGDGDMDVLSSSDNDEKIAWYENLDGQGNFGTQQIITIDAIGASSVHAADLDGDGDMDVLTASRIDSKIAWHENIDGQGNFSIEQIISLSAESARFVYAADLDGDGDLDVLSASESDDEITWNENIDGLGTFGLDQIITATADEAKSVYATDIDNDGDLDVLSASYGDNKLAWYENTDGLGSFSAPKIITINIEGTESVFAADINGDGFIDVLSASELDDKIAWYENLGILGNVINGVVRLDMNTNGCDASDLPVTDLMVVSDNGVNSFSSFSQNNGSYLMYTNEGNFTTVVTSEFPDYFSVTPNEHISNFVGLGNQTIGDFCIESSQIINDLNVTLFPTSEARPGFDASYQLIYHNIGSTQLSGTIVLEYNDMKLNFLTTSEPVSSQTNNTLTFDYVDLNPFETRIIDLTFNVFEPPTVNINDTLSFVATINPIAGDYTEADNGFTLNQIVIGSYDPNDITVLEGDEVLLEDAGNYLHYIIRFQNTGTADAINVRVENTLDANLDWQTLQLESISHTNRVEIIDGNEVSFIFDNIHLPDSTTNEPESHGFIAYKIKPKSDIALGDIISNEADIFFDFNPAVETNTVNTEIVIPLSVDEKTLLNFSVYPVPASDVLRIDSKITITQIELYNPLGQLVLSNANETKVDISMLNPGVYFCKIKDVTGSSGVRKIIKE